MSKRDLQSVKDMKKDISENFQGATESTAMKELRERKKKLKSIDESGYHVD